MLVFNCYNIYCRGLDEIYFISEVQIRRGLQLFSPQYLSYYPTKPYVVGTYKNRLIEKILLSTYNIGLVDEIRILEQEKRSLSKAL